MAGLPNTHPDPNRNKLNLSDWLKSGWVWTVGAIIAVGTTAIGMFGGGKGESVGHALKHDPYEDKIVMNNKAALKKQQEQEQAQPYRYDGFVTELTKQVHGTPANIDSLIPTVDGKKDLSQKNDKLHVRVGNTMGNVGLAQAPDITIDQTKKPHQRSGTTNSVKNRLANSQAGSTVDSPVPPRTDSTGLSLKERRNLLSRGK